MQNEKLRYQPNKKSQLLVMIGMILMLVALFLVINVFKYTNLEKEERLIKPTIGLGIEILIAIFVLLLSFLLGEKFKTYEEKWLYVGVALTAYPIVKIFIYPIKIYKRFNVIINAGYEIKYVPSRWLITVIALLVTSSIFYLMATITSYIKINQLKQYYKELESSGRE